VLLGAGGFFSAVGAGLADWSSGSSTLSVNRRLSRRTSLYPGFCWYPVLYLLFLLFLLVALASALAGFDVFLGFPPATKRAFLAASSSFCSDLLFDLSDLFFLHFFFEIFVVPEVGFIRMLSAASRGSRTTS
jgi:hypothetical protein